MMPWKRKHREDMMTISRHESVEVAHMADAALMIYAGWSYGDYKEWIVGEPRNDVITELEWDAADAFGNFVHDAVARWIADVEKEIDEDVV